MTKKYHNDNMIIGDSMKNKGFTLVELLAVITILAIIMVIATTNVLKSINDSKEKTRYMAAKEIVKIAEVYFANNSCATDVTIGNISEYLESDATNPKTGKNDLKINGQSHKICRNITAELKSSCELDISERTYNAQEGFSNNSGFGYEFDGYWYGFSSCNSK